TGLGWLALLSFPLMVGPFSYTTVLWVTISVAVIVALLSIGVAKYGWGLSVENVPSKNLVANLGTKPTVWFVAHFDSKAQKASMAGRVVSVVLAGLGVALLAVELILRAGGPIEHIFVLPGVLLCVIGTYRLTGPPLVGESPGAVDNASGIVASLAAASELAKDRDVGILVTGAEEFGMEGARHFVASRPARSKNFLRFVNFDGIDDRGRLNVSLHGSSRSGWSRLAAGAVGRKWVERGGRLRRAALPVGIFVDGGVLQRSGAEGITVARGTWDTLKVVHTPEDMPARMDPLAAAAVGVTVAEALRPVLG
ncbi:MAG: M28 family metallopeptidase, partial [Gemmatimonadota bacterium]|nr:M28 family metallopeptidase [Gemmatimonadota bacterium]